MIPRGIKRLFAFPFRTPDDVRADVREEFRFHLDMRQEELMRLGLSADAARAQAQREFGDQARGAAACVTQGDRLERHRRIARLAGDLRQDALIGLRLLGRSPGFTVVAMLMLALGIGANTAIFSALDAVLLRPLPYRAPDRLVELFETRENGEPNAVSGGAYLDWRTHQTQFSGIALLNRVTYNLRGSGAPEQLTGIEASHELFQVLGVAPFLGRGFLPDDDRPGGRHDVVVLTEELWRSRFGGDASIIGTSILLDEAPRTVVGILPRGAWLFPDQLFFVPAVLEPGSPRARRAPHWGMVFGRLKADATAVRAEAELKSIKRQLAADYPGFKQAWSVGLRPLPELIGAQSRPSLLILLGAVSLVLLIACANVANLLLARARGREQEIALRAALGATGSRIMRQVLTESVMLALLGGLAGMAIAFGGVHLLRYAIADLIPGAPAPQLDARVLLFSLALTGATGLLFGIFPALRARRHDLNHTLKNGGKSATAGGRQRAQSTLVMAEVALTLILVATAGLLLRSLANTAAVDPGFQPERVLAFDVSLPETTYAAPERRLAYSAELLARLRALPGVETAGTGMAIPFSGGGFGEFFAPTAGAEQRDTLLGRMDFVSPGYLEALGLRLVSGRLLTDADNRQPGPRVAVVSASTARAFFRDGAAIGRSLNIAGEDWRIVGVVGDKVDVRLDAASRPFAYVPQAFNSTAFSVAVRSSLPPLSLVPAVLRELQRLDAGVALANPRALDQARQGSLTQRRMVLALVGLFAAGALALAAIGLYGVMAYSVVTRRREICIRLALGAERRDVIVQVLRDGGRLVAAGLAIGLLGAFGTARLLASQLYDVRGDDPSVIGGTVLSIVAMALIACWMPAWRASRVNPIAALRND